MSNDEPYDFIDPEQYERKKAVQRAVEAKEDRRHPKDFPETRNRTFGRSILTPKEVEDPDVDADKIVEELEEEMDEEPEEGAELKEPEKVGGGSPDSSGIVSRIKTAVGGFFF